MPPVHAEPLNFLVARAEQLDKSCSAVYLRLDDPMPLRSCGPQVLEVHEALMDCGLGL